MVVGITQRELGREIGVTYQQVQKYEDGRNRIGASRLQQIARVLEVPVEYFFQGGPGDESGAVGNSDDTVRYLSTSDSVELVKVFSLITDRRIRREIIRLVAAIAEARAGGRAQPKLNGGSAVIKSRPDDKAGGGPG